MSGDKSSPAERQRAQYRKGQAEKFAWIKEAGADPTLSDATFRVLSLCAIHEAGGKGHWTGKRVHLAQLCGVSVRKFDRAIADGIAKNYIYTDLDAEDRRAHIYHMFTVEERYELFYDELNKWRREYRSWLDAERWFIDNQRREWLNAEKRFVQNWVDAEKQFAREWFVAERDARHDYERRLFDAIYARCGNSDFAMFQARSAWKEHHGGRQALPLPDIIAAIAAMPQDRFPEPDAETVVGAAAGNTPAESGNYLAGSVDKVGESGDYVAKSDQVITNCDALNSGNNRSPYAQVLQVPQVLEVAPATPGGYAGAQEQHIIPAPAVDTGRPTRSAADCTLCDEAGYFLDTDGHRVELIPEESDDFEWLECQHHISANVAEARRIDAESEGYWQVGLTGWIPFDSQFPHLADCHENIAEMVMGGGIMDVAQSRESFSALGHSE